MSNPLRGGPKKVRIISTPNGIGNYFHELWTNSKIFSRHRVTIHEAVEQRRKPTPQQIEALRPRVRLARKVCVDYTGAGVGLGDALAQEFGGKVELCTFTAGLKEEIFVKLRAAFERRSLWIPKSTEIREDLHSVHRVVSNSGQISFRASRTTDGHSDRCTALALALRAVESAPVSQCASTVGRKYAMGLRAPRRWY